MALIELRAPRCSVTLTVTDNQGATGEPAAAHCHVPVRNSSPVPTILEQSEALEATFGGGRSADSDGTIVSYRRAFRDGKARTLPTGRTSTRPPAATPWS